MNSLIRVLFLTPVYQGMRRRYHLYMQQGCTVLTAFLTTLALPLCWIFLRLESPSWQRVIQNRTYWFPQISPIRPRLGDGLRYLLQGLWLLLTYPESRNEKRHQPAAAGKKWVKHKRQGYIRWLGNIPERFELQRLEQSLITRLTPSSKRTRRVMFIILGIFTGILALLCISQPFGMMAQFVFVLLLWALAMVMRRVPGRLPTLMLIVLSLTVSCRYLWWRYTETLNWDDPVSLVCGLLLLFAETYAWVVLVLGYFQTIWPLNRQPVAMPDDINSWPTIDLMVPTYNEDLGVVKPTIYAALGIDWPKDKINIYILDDGNRPAFKAFAAEVGVHYIARPTHEHAKAGNINHALKQANGEFVAIFDCDHVPTRSFLQLTLGWFFKDTKLGILQTPHHFFSPDPFERNLGRFRQTPNEGTLFYGLVQDGNDMWDATFFCGSCAVLRRSALDAVGGIAVETVTEDAHTSLRMHRKGYSSAYIRIPQAAGLATESLSAHIGQSTIDFSGYRHFMEMPDLRAFANAGFPFSRMADLSETLVLVPPKPAPAQITTLLNAVGNIGAQVGYPAVGINITDNGSQVKEKDADVLIIGTIPPELRNDRQINVLVEQTLSWLKMPNRQTDLPTIMAPQSDWMADSQATISSEGAMSAIIGMQSPHFPQRSIVALLADGSRGYSLLNNALLDTGKREAIFGSVAVIRESGVNSLRVGETYEVGHLPWWERIWYALSTHPVLLAGVAVLVVVMAAMMVWRVLRLISRRRLSPDERD